jgi:hypothetical protein
MRRTDDLTTPATGHPYLGGVSLPEFREDLAIAQGLLSRRYEQRERATSKLLAMGPPAVRLAAYTIEEVICDRDATDDDIERQMDIVSSLVRGMGRDSAPVLDDLATNGHCNIAVNDWAQRLLFEVLGLEGKARQKACHHGMMSTERRGRKEVWVCLHCDAEFGDGEHPAEEAEPTKWKSHR